MTSSEIGIALFNWQFGNTPQIYLNFRAAAERHFITSLLEANNIPQAHPRHEQVHGYVTDVVLRLIIEYFNIDITAEPGISDGTFSTHMQGDNCIGIIFDQKIMGPLAELCTNSNVPVTIFPSSRMDKLPPGVPLKGAPKNLDDLSREIEEKTRREVAKFLASPRTYRMDAIKNQRFCRTPLIDPKNDAFSFARLYEPVTPVLEATQG